MQNKILDSKLSYFSWFLAAFFFIYQYVSRLSPGIISNELMQHFQINAAEFSRLATSYYLIYSLMQIPMGVLLDKFGPRYVIFCMSLLCGLMNLIFISTTNLNLAIFCRAVMGFSSVAGFIGTAKIISLYFTPEKRNRMISLTFTIGLGGAFMSNQPLAYIMEIFGWKNVLFFNGVIGIAIAFFILFFIKNQRDIINQTKEKVQIKKFSMDEVVAVIKNKYILITGLAGFLAAGSYTAFADVWGVAFFNNILNLNKESASFVVSNIYLGMCLGGLILSFLGEKYDKYLLASFASFTIGFLMLFVIFRFTNNEIILSILMLIVGVMSSYQILLFIIIIDLVPKHLYAVATSVTNTMIMASGSFFHFVIGFLMEFFYQSNITVGIHKSNISGMLRYGAMEFSCSLVILPMAAIIAAGVFAYFGIKKQEI